MLFNLVKVRNHADHILNNSILALNKLNNSFFNSVDKNFFNTIFNNLKTRYLRIYVN